MYFPLSKQKKFFEKMLFKIFYLKQSKIIFRGTNQENSLKEQTVCKCFELFFRWWRRCRLGRGSKQIQSYFASLALSSLAEKYSLPKF